MLKVVRFEGNVDVWEDDEGIYCDERTEIPDGKEGCTAVVDGHILTYVRETPSSELFLVEKRPLTLRKDVDLCQNQI